jgi:CRISPR/Cas system-associated exonuclease Cas4 (RecB family)
MFAACPRQYYLGRYLRLKSSGGIDVAGDEELPDRDSSVSAADLGIQVHTLLAGSVVAEPATEAVKLADVFRSSNLFQLAERATRVEREWEFAFVLEDVIIRGAIDLWFEHDGRITIVDYKTDQVDGAKENGAKLAAHSLQLRIYALALEKALGRRVDCAYLHYLRPNLVKEVSLQPTLFESPEAIVRAFREAHETLDFPLREGIHCRRCDFFRGLCPAGAMRSAAAP